MTLFLAAFCNLKFVQFKETLEVFVIEVTQDALLGIRTFFNNQDSRLQNELQTRLGKEVTLITGTGTETVAVVPEDRTFIEVIFIGSPVAGCQRFLLDKESGIISNKRLEGAQRVHA